MHDTSPTVSWSKITLAKRAFKLAWTDKRLWLLGLFAGAGSASGGGSSSSVSGTAGDFAYPDGGTLLLIILGLAVAALVLVAAFALANVLCEGALIDAVRERERGADGTLAHHLARSTRVGKSVFGLKVAVGLGRLLVALPASIPALLGYFEIIPMWLGAGLAVLLFLLMFPFAATLHFALQFGLRFVVLEGRGALDGLRAGFRFLRGRVLAAIGLFFTVIGGQMIIGAGGALCALPGVVGGLLVGLGAGVLPGVAAGATWVLPVAVATVAFQSTFESTLWTLAFLDERPTAA